MGGKGAAQRDPAQPDTRAGGEFKNPPGSNLHIRPIMRRASATSGRQPGAHNRRPYVTLLPDKTLRHAQERRRPVRQANVATSAAQGLGGPHEAHSGVRVAEPKGNPRQQNDKPMAKPWAQRPAGTA